MIAAYVRDSPRGAVLSLRVIPRSSSNAVAGIRGDALKVRVTAPPVDSAANAEVTHFLAAVLGVSRGSVQLLRGDTGRQKQVLVTGMTAQQVGERLRPLLEGT